MVLDNELVPDKCKLHFASWNGEEDPLDVFLAGNFDEWQSWQARKNFKLPYVVSLIALPKSSHWIFAGAYDSLGCDWKEKHGAYRYRLRRRDRPSEFEGRLIAAFERPGRQSYLLGERWHHAILVAEIRPDRIQVSEFPGYSAAMLTKQHLDIVVAQEIESWRSALSNVAGIYVIADRNTGKLYVGSATGGEGIWSRWCAYSATGHGNNRELRELLRREGKQYSEYFQFGVLEIADTHASSDDVLERESHWKNLLLTRVPHGLNAN